MNTDPRTRRHSGFTLVELLVVVVIVIIISAVTLPAVLPALANRQVSEGARILQAALAGARDSAIRFNAPRGVRLIPDLMSNQVSPLTGKTDGQTFTYNRMVAIEPAPDISDGMATFPTTMATWLDASGQPNPPAFPFPFPGDTGYTPPRGVYPHPSPITTKNQVLVVEEAVFDSNLPPTPNPPANWFWNVRIGDRFRFHDSGRYYTVVGPMTAYNPELMVNDGPPGAPSSLVETYYDRSVPAKPVNARPQFLFLVNGVDDDKDGIIDNGVNGINDNLNFYNRSSGTVTITVGPPTNVDINDDIFEWIETEQWLGSQAAQSQAVNWTIPVGGTVASPPTIPYTIARRPVPVGSAAEVSLPAAVVIDATTWDTTRERSRIPVDMTTGYVDIMLNQSGQVVPTTTYSSPASATMDASFYHFWIADRGDVYAPSPPPSGSVLTLPIPNGNYPASAAELSSGSFTYKWPGTLSLKKDRHLVTLFTRTGNILTNSIENFDPTNAAGGGNYPFLNAELGIREAK